MSSEKPQAPPTNAPSDMEEDVPPSTLEDETEFAEQAQKIAEEENPELAEALARARTAVAAAKASED